MARNVVRKSFLTRAKEMSKRFNIVGKFTGFPIALIMIGLGELAFISMSNIKNAYIFIFDNKQTLKA